MVENNKKKVLSRLSLNTPENSRKTLSRIIREFNNGNIPETTYRGLVYGMDKLLKYWAFEKELEIEKRLDILEQKVNEA